MPLPQLEKAWDEWVTEGTVGEAYFSLTDGSAVVLLMSARERRLCRRFRNDSEAVGLGKVCLETNVHR